MGRDWAQCVAIGDHSRYGQDRWRSVDTDATQWFSHSSDTEPGERKHTSLGRHGHRRRVTFRKRPRLVLNSAEELKRKMQSAP